MPLTDHDLVLRAKNGDSAAFGQLVRRHQQRIYRLIVHVVKDQAEAEDVTQETFVRAFRALHRFDGRSEPYTWLYRIALNLGLNALRARRTRKATSTESADDVRLEALAAVRSVREPNDPGARAEDREMYVALCNAMDTLSDTLRTTLILVCIDGRSHEEASKILGAPEGTIAWRVHEARRKLKEHLLTRGIDPEGDPR